MKYVFCTKEKLWSAANVMNLLNEMVTTNVCMIYNNCDFK